MPGIVRIKVLSYRSLAVRESTLEGSYDDVLVLLLYYAGCSGEYPESGFPLSGVIRLAGLEQSSKEFWPLNTCTH
jgi:hypothetical protein